MSGEEVIQNYFICVLLTNLFNQRLLVLFSLYKIRNHFQIEAIHLLYKCKCWRTLR